MNNRQIQEAGILVLLFALGVATSVQSAELDIAPLFAGYERGCEISGTAAEQLVVWATPDRKGSIASTDALPPLWRNHVGAAPIVTDRIDHWYVIVPLRGIRFHGLRVTTLERWYGKASGISGWSLVLASSLVKARLHIDEKGFRLDASGNFKPELVPDQTGQGAQLVCDISM